MNIVTERHRVPGTIDIARPGYVRDDPSEGYNTYDVFLTLKGYSQSFGGLYLPDGDVEKFEADLLKAAGVKHRDQLKGLKIHALYAFGKHNEFIEGLEFENGNRFTITGFRRKHFGFKGSVLGNKTESITNQIAHAERRLAELRADLNDISSKFVDWEQK